MNANANRFRIAWRSIVAMSNLSLLLLGETLLSFFVGEGHHANYATQPK